jgi:hypothetical protein
VPFSFASDFIAKIEKAAGSISEDLTMKKEFYAHSREGKPPRDWHPLEDHLKKAAKTAQRFADDFNAGDWAYLAGLTPRNGIETKRL